jgi:hypothetical protein
LLEGSCRPGPVRYLASDVREGEIFEAASATLVSPTAEYTPRVVGGRRQWLDHGS